MRLYKAQYAPTSPAVYDEWDEETAGDFPEPEGWAEHCHEVWGEHRAFFPPSDRPIYRSRSAAQARVSLINRWFGEGAAILVEADVAFAPVAAANARRRRQRLDAKVERISRELDEARSDRDLAMLAERLS